MRSTVGRSFDDAMSVYHQTRDARVLPIYEFTTQLATLEMPPPEMQQLLGAVYGNQRRDGRLRERHRRHRVAGRVLRPRTHRAHHGRRHDTRRPLTARRGCTLQPGWKWSECIKPVVGGDSCQARHVGAVVSGRMHIVHDDGTESDAGPGDAYVIEPGHDAWVVGDEALVGYEFESTTAGTYAQPK